MIGVASWVMTTKPSKNSNGCACFVLPFEESKEVNYDREYVITVTPLRSKREIKRGPSTKIVIQT